MQTNEISVESVCGVSEQFRVLKQRLLHERLNKTPEFETHALIMREADVSSFLAWLTPYPFLTFPCLFEERAVKATEQSRREAQLYWSNLVGTSGRLCLNPTVPIEALVSARNVTQMSQCRHDFAVARS
jgi:hypothetical protein